MRNNIIDLLPKIKEGNNNIVITTHSKPDADALGSSLGLMHFLRKFGNRVDVVAPTSYPDFIKWMPGNSEVIIFDEESNLDEVTDTVLKADLVICTDFSRLNRIDQLEKVIRKHNDNFVLIDHHLDPEKFATFELWDPKGSSACELVYRAIEEFDELEKIDQNIASCLYAGIMTDTGSFRFPSTTPYVHRVLATLMETGIDHAKIHRLVYDNNSESKLRLLGHSISSKLTILLEIKTAYIILTQEELSHFNYQQGDTEGVVNYALSLSGINFAAIFMEKDNAVKMSFRSVGNFNVAEFSNKHFNGGGHKNAAGGKIKNNTINEIEEIFVSLLPLYKQEIINSDK